MDGELADVVWLWEIWFLVRKELMMVLMQGPLQLLCLLFEARADDQLEVCISHVIYVEIAVEMGSVGRRLRRWTLALHLVTLVDSMDHFDVIWNLN